jgi:uncharacterized protein with PIN domain
MTGKTNDQFKKEVFDLVGDEYTFLSYYVNNKTKLKVKHNKCGNVYEVRPDSFLQGKRCPYCSANFHPKKTNGQFKKEVYDLVGDEYTFLEPYVNSQTKIRVKHNKCGNVYEVQPRAFRSGTRCPYCYGKIKKTDAEFKKEVYDLVGNEYIFLEPYQGTLTKLKVRHNKCGNTYEIRPVDFLRGIRCLHCHGNIRKTNDQFKKEVFDLVGSDYTVLDAYINNATKLRVKHNICGNVYKVRPVDFLSHQTRCPYCSSPKGELLINKILKSLGIEYEYQKTFEDLKDVHLLSYDFFIPSQNILIEYQGQQHYQPVDYFGGETTFKRQQNHDKMKSDYAKLHEYNLIAIPYTEDTFAKIKKYLVKHGLKNI